jgi:hypothetical protein
MDLQVGTSISDEHVASIFSPEGGGNTFLQNVGSCVQAHMMSQPRRPSWIFSLL